MKKISKTSVVPSIQVAPLIDIMLVLLVVFMIAAPTMLGGIKMEEVPEGTVSEIDAADSTVIISIDKENNLFVEGEKSDINLMPKVIAAKFKTKDITAIVQGDRSITYGSAVKVIDALHAAGYVKTVLLTDIN